MNKMKIRNGSNIGHKNKNAFNTVYDYISGVVFNFLRIVTDPRFGQ